MRVFGALAASAILLTACTDGTADRGPQSPFGSPPATEISVSSSSLILDQIHAGGGLYDEGAFSYVRLRQVGGRLVSAKEFRDLRLTRPLLRLEISAGDYSLESYQRPCDAACPAWGSGTLDLPVDRCAATFNVMPGERVIAAVVLRPGAGCSIEFGRLFTPQLARQMGMALCARGVRSRLALRELAQGLNAASSRPESIGRAYAQEAFPEFESEVKEAATSGCQEALTQG